jgi:hypothetical protein
MNYGVNQFVFRYRGAVIVKGDGADGRAHALCAEPEGVLGHDVFLFGREDFLAGPQLQTIVDRSETLGGAFSHGKLVRFCGEIFRGHRTDGGF